MGKKFHSLTFFTQNPNKKVIFEMGWRLYRTDPHLFDEVEGLLLQADINEISRFSGRFRLQVTKKTAIAGFVNHDARHNIIDVLITDVYYEADSYYKNSYYKKKKKVI